MHCVYQFYWLWPFWPSHFPHLPIFFICTFFYHFCQFFLISYWRFFSPYSSSFTSLLLINAIASFLFSLTSFWALRNKTASQFRFLDHFSLFGYLLNSRLYSAFFTLSKIPLAFFSTKLFPVSMSFLSVCGIVFGKYFSLPPFPLVKYNLFFIILKFLF